MSIILQSAFFNPSVNLFGRGTVNEVGTKLAGLGVKKALLVSDEGLNAIGVVDQVAGIIQEAGIKVAIFAKTEPNPTDKNVAEGLEFYFAESCDGIVTLGGGSSHDCGKGIGLVAANGGTIHGYEGVDKSAKPMVPTITINTTAGTGSDVTRFTVITNTAKKVKMAIVDKHVFLSI